MKSRLARLLAACARIYMQHLPFRAGKQFLWDHLVTRRLLWRDFQVEAHTRFGAVIEGEMQDGIISNLYFFGVHEPGLTLVFQTLLRPGDVCIDIGANVGAHTLLAASLVGAQGEVHAIEASPTIFARLQHNIARNHADQVRLYNVAVTDKAGPVTVFLHGARNSGATTILQDVADERAAGSEATIHGDTLDAILPADAVARAVLIKIDVEGAEWLVLQGMRALLPRLRPECVVLIELNDDALARFGRTAADVMALFAETGHVPFEIANRYDPAFYFATPRVLVRSPGARADGIVDLGFARPEIVAGLLAA